MTHNLSHDVLKKLSEHLAVEMGLHFSDERLSDLEKNIHALSSAFGFEEDDDFANWLSAGRLTQEQIELLADYLTVGETYFFRDPRVFTVLQEEIFPQLIASRAHNKFLRIWSAACCTGEEPYSLAMLLHNLLPDISSWQIKIMATDINQSFLQKAREGIYSNWSFRATEQGMKDKYFKRTADGAYQISPAIRKMVHFSWMNLADFSSVDVSSLSCMDIIFCRNVFIYFDANHARQIMTKLTECLTNDGYLFVSPNELQVSNVPGLTSMHRPGAIVLKKVAERETGDFAFEHEHGAAHHVYEDKPAKAEHADVKTAPPPTYEEALKAYDDSEYKTAVELLLIRCKTMADFPSLTLLTRSFANQGDLENALKWCELAIKSNRLHAPTYYLRATILQEAGQTAQAIKSLRQSLLMNAGFVLAEFTLANLLRQSGDRKNAVRHFNATLEMLANYKDDDILPESDGTTASGLRHIVSSLIADSSKSGSF